jgi:lipopolysaccharide export system permease protein
MLFHSSLRKELSRSFGATLIVLITVVMTMILIRTLGQASRGGFNPSDVTLVMGYTVLAYLPTLLTMSLFIAIIATLSRMYRDSEMVIWLCSGQGLAGLLRPLVRFSWPVFLVVAALSLVLLPWSKGRIEVLKNQYEQRSDIERIVPGRFQESASGNRVFFVEKNPATDQAGSNVFIASTEHGRQTVTSARSGRIEALPQGQFLMLSNGQRLESNLTTNDLKISEFEVYGTQVSNDVLGANTTEPAKTQTTLTLINRIEAASNQAELSWRFGMIVAVLNFVIIGLAVSSVNPRVNKSVNLVFSLFTFVTYYNLINLGQSWIVSGKVEAATYMASLHGGIFILAVLWLAKVHNNWSLSHLFTRRRGVLTAAEQAT